MIGLGFVKDNGRWSYSIVSRMSALIKTSTYTTLGRHCCPLAQSGKHFWKKIFWDLAKNPLWFFFVAYLVINERGCYWPSTLMGFVHFKLNQISNIDALPCTGCLWTGVSGNSRSRSLLEMEASDSRSRIVDMDFLFPYHSQTLGLPFFIPFPFPNFGNGFCHSLSVSELKYY